MRKILCSGTMAAMMLAMTATVAGAAEIPRSIPHRQVGKASFYSTKLQGRPMTNGEPFDASSSAAASKTLPIGTKARVTNLKTGKSAEVTIKDRGPVPKGRVVDLTPHTAQQIGLTKKEGLAPVVVVPTSVPAKATETASSSAR